MKYGISGIKEQEKLEKLPLFNKQTGGLLIGKKEGNLDKKIQRLLNKGYLINLKKGWYVSKPYLDQEDNMESYAQYLANKLRSPSYLSLEYMLSQYNLIPEAINAWTSISLKTTRTYKNEIGIFIYKNIKKNLFLGYQPFNFKKYRLYRAVKAKALFDYLYLKTNLSENLDYELSEGLRLNWAEFSKKDLKLFSGFVKASGMKKMEKVLLIIKKIINAR